MTLVNILNSLKNWYLKFYEKIKIIYLPLGKHFYESEVNMIEESLRKFPLEDITIGDAGEINNCKVGRLMEDHPNLFLKLETKDYQNQY